MGSDVVAHTDGPGRIGFNPQYLRLNLGPGASQKIEIMLDPGPQILPEITVTAKEAKPVEFAWTTKYDDFFRRRNLGQGGTEIRFPRCNDGCVAVWIDG